MSSQVDITKEKVALSSIWGGVRGGIVELATHPLDVVKTRLQCSQNSENTIQIARRIFQQEGPSTFYKGLSPQLLKTCLKQVWCWPMITGVPCYLESYGIKDTHQQILTGLFIGTVDAAIATPLEKAKVLLIMTKKASFSLDNIYKDGWHGFTAYWAKRSVNMVTFLTAQKHLRDRAHAESEQSLSLYESAKIGTQAALIVSLVSAPFDNANTLKQAEIDNANALKQSKTWSVSQFFPRNGILKSYRGWHLNALSLIIHNIASVMVLEKLNR